MGIMIWVHQSSPRGEGGGDLFGTNFFAEMTLESAAAEAELEWQGGLAGSWTQPWPPSKVFSAMPRPGRRAAPGQTLLPAGAFLWVSGELSGVSGSRMQVKRVGGWVAGRPMQTEW